ncbi:MAG TPA: hypothetical protein VFG69_16955 [Nannocystaceae bacterium]|nr:hypothetical protein [Nannocystaceae bacterium]
MLHRRLVIASLLLASAACSTAPDDVCLAERRLAVNRLSANRIALNRIALNRISLNRIALNGLNAVLGPELPLTSLTSESVVELVPQRSFADSFVQDVLEYTVSCALAPEQSIEVPAGDTTRVYTGSLGLAPQWGEAGGQCDAACRGWVSACLIARTNDLGVSRPISLLGDHESLAPTADEAELFTIEEATYFGDLFAEPRTLYACLPAGASGPERTCGDHPQDCAIAVLGECDAVCDDAGCRDPNGLVHTQTITVNLPQDATSCD